VRISVDLWRSRLGRSLKSCRTTIGKRQGSISEIDYAAVYAAAEKQSKMLSGLRKSLAT
jgi:hypothetical protein